jgi:hypothetical protein
MIIQKYKNREVDFSAPVDMYRCLNRSGFCFSLRQRGKVVGHTTDVVIKNCTLVVNRSGKNKALKTQQRNVHAFVRGYLSEEVGLSFSWQLMYKPFEPQGFCIEMGGELIELNSCKSVYIENKKVMCQI